MTRHQRASRGLGLLAISQVTLDHLDNPYQHHRNPDLFLSWDKLKPMESLQTAWE